MIQSDKAKEKSRYDRRGLVHLRAGLWETCCSGAEAIEPFLRPPYALYEALIGRTLSPGLVALEIGAGTGEFSGAAIDAGATLVATDISERSLEALVARFSEVEEGLYVLAADMEDLPFDNESFDAVISAGSLSYGNNLTVLKEIFRILKPGGFFICVDTLNHNPIYRLNRFIHYLRGNRTRGTLRRMPTLRLIDEYRKRFGNVEVRFFGSAVWLVRLISPFVNQRWGASLSAFIDRSVSVSWSAFKFVMIATKNGG